MAKILIIDDHPLFRESLAHILKKLSPRNTPFTIYEAENSASALKVIAANSDLKLILTDIDMPGISGLSLLEQLRELTPEAAVVMISGSENHTDAKTSLRLGARGFIQKSTETPILLAALQLILAGGTYIPPLILDECISSQPEQQKQAVLTDRQLEILGHLQHGQQNKFIAHELDLSEATVKVHVRHIFSVLGVKNRVQAVQKARELRLL